MPLGDFQNQVLGPKRPATESEGGSGEDPIFFEVIIVTYIVLQCKAPSTSGAVIKYTKQRVTRILLGYLHNEELVENGRFQQRRVLSKMVHVETKNHPLFWQN